MPVKSEDGKKTLKAQVADLESRIEDESKHAHTKAKYETDIDELRSQLEQSFSIWFGQYLSRKWGQSRISLRTRFLH